MPIKQLYTQLLAGYTQENLHAITTKIIRLHRNRQYTAIHGIMSVVSGFTKEKEEQYTKAFYKLMMLYHPDRINHYRAEIDRHYAANDAEQLQRFSHIFPVLELEPTLAVLPRQDAENTDQYAWDDAADGFDYRDEADEDGAPAAADPDMYNDGVDGTDFFSVFKRIIYGHANIELPVHYLEDIDNVDLAGYDISDLDGVRYCKHLVTLDLSNNSIIDVSELGSLERLKELYLADNRIGYIDGLGYLTNLRILDISNNGVTDIAALFELEHLEYVNLVGNRISDAQIRVLEQNGVLVIS